MITSDEPPPREFSDRDTGMYWGAAGAHPRDGLGGKDGVLSNCEEWVLFKKVGSSCERKEREMCHADDQGQLEVTNPSWFCSLTPPLLAYLAYLRFRVLGSTHLPSSTFPKPVQPSGLNSQRRLRKRFIDSWGRLEHRNGLTKEADRLLN